MCFMGGGRQQPQATTPARAPAAPLPDAEEAEIGAARKQETEENFGSDRPSYRGRRSEKGPDISPSGPVMM